MRKYKIIPLAIFGFLFISLLPKIKSYETVAGAFTHCYGEGKGSGDGGFYKCSEFSCEWVEDDDPKLSTSQECDQSPIIN